MTLNAASITIGRNPTSIPLILDWAVSALICCCRRWRVRTISDRRPIMDCQRAANFRLYAHRDYQQAEIVLRHALEHLFQCARERQSKAALFDRGAEFA